jgi:hypothetical protein
MSDKPGLLEGYIPERQYCEEVGISLRTAQRHRRAGKSLPYVIIHRTPYYNVAKGRQHLASQEVEPVRNQTISNARGPQQPRSRTGR